MISNSSKFVGEGLTYDDVLLIPAYSEVLPREVSLLNRVFIVLLLLVESLEFLCSCIVTKLTFVPYRIEDRSW